MCLAIRNLLRSALICSFLATFYSGNIFKANAQSELESLSLACVRGENRLTCKDAILLTDRLQLRAESRGLYSCQTRLLGLGNTLTMLTLNTYSSDFVLSALKEVNLYCEKL